MQLTQLFVRRPTLAMVFCCLVVLAGVLAWHTLVQQQFPNIDFPTVSVRLSYSGAPPSEIRDAIVRPIEDAIAGAPDLDHINSNIQQGTANVTATFSLGSDLTTDLVEVQRRVQSVGSSLPTDLTAPTISTFDPSEANVATLTVTSSTLSAAALSEEVNDQVVPEMEQIDGVASVSANGAVTPAIEVNVDPNKIRSADLTLGDVVTAISSNNVRAPGGLIYGPARETSVDVRGDLSDVASVAQLPIAPAAGTGHANLTGPSGGSSVQSPLTGAAPGTTASTSVAANASAAAAKVTAASTTTIGGTNPFSVSTRQLRVADVATVDDSYEVKRVFSYVNGYPAISLNMQKQTGASEVSASQNVLDALPTLQKEYPQLRFSVLNLQSTYTEQQLDSVYKTIAEAIAFTGIVMLFFLRSWRNSIVVLIAIPTSLGVTIFLMSLLNFSIDTISLLAMTLVIGILVDDSIVVLENTERHFENGEAPQTAAILGRTEIGPAAVVITLVDVVVFAPISFLPGTVGRFFSEFGLVVVAATLTSLFVSFTVTPALAGNWSLKSKWKPPVVIDWFSHGFERARGFYVDHFLNFALGHRWLTVIACFVAVGISLALIPLGLIGFDFIPPVDIGQVFVNVNFPIGTPLTVTTAAIQRMAQEENGNPNVQSSTATAGQYSSGFGGGFTVGSSGQVQFFLRDDRRISTTDFATMVQRRWTAEFPHAKIVAIGSTGTGGGSSQPIDYTITSTDDEPEKYVPAVQALLQNTPGAIAVNSSLTNAVPQVDVVFDRERARALDVSIATGANAVRASFGGSLAAQFATAFGTKYVQVTYPESAQSSLAAIDDIPIRNNSGGTLTVGDISSIVNDPTPPQIQRINRQSVIHVGANAAPGVVLSKVQSAFMQGVPSLHLPAGVQLKPSAGGQQQNLVQTVSGLGYALLLAIVLVYLLMVALYDSYVLPFIIMFAVPVASVGALGSLALTNQPLDLFSLIGTVMLVGLASKNGILLVDFANHRLRAGIDRVSAVRESAKERFRPIVMTTVSMMAGMTPIALAIDPGSSVRQALGVVVIGGLVSSLVLTLVLVPVVFCALAPDYTKPRKKKRGPKVPVEPALGGEGIVRQPVPTRLASEGNAP